VRWGPSRRRARHWMDMRSAAAPVSLPRSFYSPSARASPGDGPAACPALPAGSRGSASVLRCTSATATASASRPHDAPAQNGHAVATHAPTTLGLPGKVPRVAGSSSGRGVHLPVGGRCPSRSAPGRSRSGPQTTASPSCAGVFFGLDPSSARRAPLGPTSRSRLFFPLLPAAGHVPAPNSCASNGRPAAGNTPTLRPRSATTWPSLLPCGYAPPPPPYHFHGHTLAHRRRADRGHHGSGRRPRDRALARTAPVGGSNHCARPSPHGGRYTGCTWSTPRRTRCGPPPAATAAAVRWSFRLPPAISTDYPARPSRGANQGSPAGPSARCASATADATTRHPGGGALRRPGHDQSPTPYHEASPLRGPVKRY